MLLAVCSDCYSQRFFTLESNVPRGGDLLIGERIRFDSITDLLHSRLTGEKYLDTYARNGEDSIVRIFRNTRYQYRINGDSLLLLQTEDNLRKRAYLRPRLERLFPLDGTRQASDCYEAQVDYCNNISLQQRGNRKTSISKIPYVLLPSGDTLKLAMLYTVEDDCYIINRDSSFVNGEYVEKSDSSHFTEKQEWLYAVGYRYPIVEYYSLSEADGTKQTVAEDACYFAPDYQKFNMDDDINGAVREMAGDMPSWGDERKWSDKDDDISQYIATDRDGRNISLSFRSDVPVSGMLILSDVPGRVYRSSAFAGSAGEQVSAGINYAGLRKGSYVIHVKINTKTYKCTFYID